MSFLKSLSAYPPLIYCRRTYRLSILCFIFPLNLWLKSTYFKNCVVWCWMHYVDFNTNLSCISTLRIEFFRFFFKSYWIWRWNFVTFFFSFALDFVRLLSFIVSNPIFMSYLCIISSGYFCLFFFKETVSVGLTVWESI